MTRYLNKTAIEWADYTWNPVVGCRHGCPYCYAEALCKRFASNWGRDPNDPFKPEFYPERLDAPQRLDTPSRIFAVSMGDLFGKWVPSRWINSVMVAIARAPRHTFMLLTKDASRLEYYCNTVGVPENLWVGVSVENAENCNRLDNLNWTDHDKKFVSFEPLLDDVTKSPYFDLSGINWIIIGAQTGPGAKPPCVFDINNLVAAAYKEGIPVFVKDNLVDHWIDGRPPQQFPEGMI
jgi:protein gp37